MPDPHPLPLRTLTMAELPQPTGTPGDRDVLRASMPWAQSVIADHWEAFGGGVAAVTACEAGYVYRWVR